jgi:6,7-dimethyl-8-ribityllumazine synthase
MSEATVKTYEGHFDAAGLHFVLVVSRFNEVVTHQLLEGARDCLRRHGAADEQLTLVWVPGAWEIPLMAQRLARSGSFDAVICLGAVIRGATPHFDYVAGQAAAGVARASLEADLPITFGILTTDTVDQAMERAGSKAGNKGFDAAMAAIEMATLSRSLAAGPAAIGAANGRAVVHASD